jgi:hypothetical protein
MSATRVVKTHTGPSGAEQGERAPGRRQQLLAMGVLAATFLLLALPPLVAALSLVDSSAVDGLYARNSSAAAEAMRWFQLVGAGGLAVAFGVLTPAVRWKWEVEQL